MQRPDSTELAMSPGMVIAWWDRLRSTNGQTWKVAEPSGDYGDFTFLITLGPDGEPAMVAGIDPRDEPPSDTGGRNVQIGTRTISLEGQRQRVIELICSERSLEPVFAELVVDVMRRISSGTSSRHAIDRALGDFRRLLEREPTGRAEREEAIALAGELLVLDKLIRIAPHAWKSWNGPLGEIHDFHYGKRALEVKATAHVGEASMEIHGLSQLRAPEGGLHLLQVVLLPDPAGTVTVPRLAEGIRGMVDDEEGYIDRLAEAGYYPSEAARWEVHRFSTSRVSCFEVGEDFPKVTEREIVSGELPSGVTNLRYAVALSAIREWLISEDALDNVLTEFVNHHDTHG